VTTEFVVAVQIGLLTVMQSEVHCEKMGVGFTLKKKFAQKLLMNNFVFHKARPYKLYRK